MTLLCRASLFTLVLLSSLSGQVRGLQPLHAWIAIPGPDSSLLEDRVGGRHARLLGGPGFQSFGKVPAIVLDGVDDALQITPEAAPVPLPSLDLTIEAWVRPDQPPGAGGEAGIFSAIQDNGDHERGLWLGWQKSSFVFALAADGTNGVRATYVTARDPLQLGAWHHVVATWDGRFQRLFIDGKLLGEGKERTGPIAWPEKTWLELGTYRDDDEWDKAAVAIHSVEIYRGVMTPQQVAERHKARRPEFPGLALPAVLPVAAPELDRAIERGVRHLLARQETDGSWRGTGGIHQHYVGMTPLAMYTLLRCGVPSGHPAVVTARAWLDRMVARGRFTRTYDLGCALMAYGALPAAERPVELMEGLVLRLTESIGNGSIRRGPRWGYPGDHGGGGLTWFDLSNTQYALLGLRAAAKSGIGVPPRDWWMRVAEALLDDQAAYGGFGYRGGEDYSASMTTAGLGGLLICQDLIGAGIDVRLGPRLRAGITNAERWLLSQWTVEGNRHVTDEGGFRNQWHLYYLYGLERVAAFLGQDQLGGRDWHSEGCRVILRMQQGDGGFGDDYDTSFALLFLRKGSRISAPPPRAAVEEVAAGAPVVIGSGANSRVFLRTIDDVTRAKCAAAAPGALRMHWEIAGETVRSFEVADTQGLFAPEHLLEGAFSTNGEHKVRLVLELLAEKGGAPIETFKSEELSVHIDTVFEPWHREAKVGIDKNLIEADTVTVSASSEHNGDYSARFAVDQVHATAWLPAEDDRQATLEITLKKPVAARVLVLTSARAYGGAQTSYKRPKDVAISINGGRPFTRRLADVTQRKQEIPITTSPVKSIAIRVQSWYRDPSSSPHGGFKEVELFAEPIRSAGDAAHGPLSGIEWIIPPAGGDKEEWSYTFDPPASDWMVPGFRAQAWRRGLPGFGSPDRRSSNPAQTAWTGSTIWARRTFRLTDKDLASDLRIELNHDDDAEVWINGIFAANAPGFSADGYRTFPITEEVRKTLTKTANTIAVHCRNTGGVGYLDLALIRVVAP